MTTTPKSDKYTCQCGSSIKNLHTNISQHKKSAKHIKFMEANIVQIQIPEVPKKIIIENENVVENKMNTEEKKEKVPPANSLRVKAFRERQKAQLGDE
jgi:hypothetical protein